MAWNGRQCCHAWALPPAAGYGMMAGDQEDTRMKMLTQQQVESYHRDGYLYPLPALSADELAESRAGLERFETYLGGPVAKADIKWRSHAFAHSPWFAKLATHPRILDAVEDVIGPNILIWTSTFFIKEPQSPTFAAWHQDGTYFGLAPQTLITAWVALSDASHAAGCMDVVSFENNPRQMHHAALRLENSINRAGQTVVEAIDETAVEAMELKPGSFSLHHELAIHRSSPNSATHRRIGIGLNYIPTSVRTTTPVRMSAMLVRGKDEYGHFDLIDPPKGELDHAALAAHDQIGSLYRDNYNEMVKRHEAEFATAAE
jgi:non-heme Fe2+,alpha-ketoglutarate-dependent halogenase